MKLRWGRILLGAFLLEVVLFIVLVPISFILGETVFFTAVPIGCVLFGFLFGFWVARKAPALLVLHALLVGVIATALYLGLCAVAPGSLPAAVAVYGLLMFITVNVLRILGAIAGGFFAQRKRLAGI
jgi:hypothetical protein